MEDNKEVAPDQAWKAGRGAEFEHGNKGNAHASTAAFWTLPSIVRAEWSLDVWASVARSRAEGLQSSPTISAIFEIEEAPDESALPFRIEKPGSVKIMTRVESEKRQLRKLEDGTEAMVWLVWFTEQYIERLSKSATTKILSPSQVLYLTVEAWMKDIGSPRVLAGYLASLYPRRGPYEAEFGGNCIEIAAGALRLGRSSGMLEKGLGHLHKQALRDLADWLAGFGTREIAEPRRVRADIRDRKSPTPYTKATDEEMKSA
jgi:hypothetical protein